MISVAETVKQIIDEQGRTQAWIIEKMNSANSELNMNRSKFSAITTGKRKMTGDELLAFCQVLEITPDRFLYVTQS